MRIVKQVPRNKLTQEMLEAALEKAEQNGEMSYDDILSLPNIHMGLLNSRLFLEVIGNNITQAIELMSGELAGWIELMPPEEQKKFSVRVVALLGSTAMPYLPSNFRTDEDVITMAEETDWELANRHI